ncbi:hypothetical protein [Fusibacter sp. 3D3]|uniref:hypothetical protein n=1 Tax=Fusibacter sp. 3D3 TaxID=1048380 RepID=UPI0008533242|nr:hypothetical protein [Fusibacter sp. 3D3]GAU75888.1 Cob(I)alamin adenosyltransferase [Fusibacter sp. 3D3]
MSLITEAALRAMLKKETLSTLKIQKGDIVTPSARQFLRERGIALITDDSLDHIPKSDKSEAAPIKENHYKGFEPMETGIKPKFVSYYDGGFYEVKPEYMTHLRGNQLVFKDDPRILFRGKMDSIQALVLEIQYRLLDSKPALQSELKELLEVFRGLLRAEVLDEPIEIDKVIGLTDVEIREHSHYPKKYYDIEHFLPDVSMGIEIIELNRLRTYIRELELCALCAFKKGNDISRKDIIQLLNRLSSVAYIMMCRIRGQYYK